MGNMTVPVEEEVMYSRTSAKRVGCLYAVQPLYGFCDELAVAMVAVGRIGRLHNSEIEVEIGLRSYPGVEDARDIH